MGQEEYNTSTIQQIPSYNTSDALRVRLDTTILSEIEAHLKGYVLTEQWDAETQRYVTVARRVAEPLANEVGQHRLLMWVRGKVNPATVQGNFNRSAFQLHIADMMSNLNKAIHVNMQRWGIAETDIEYIVFTIMDLVEEFLSRTVDNQERKLFSTSTEHTKESRQQNGWTIGGKQWQQ